MKNHWQGGPPCQRFLSNGPSSNEFWGQLPAMTNFIQDSKNPKNHWLQLEKSLYENHCIKIIVRKSL